MRVQFRRLLFFLPHRHPRSTSFKQRKTSAVFTRSHSLCGLRGTDTTSKCCALVAPLQPKKTRSCFSQISLAARGCSIVHRSFSPPGRYSVRVSFCHNHSSTYRRNAMWPLWMKKKEHPARFEDGTGVDICRGVHLSVR